MLLLFTGELVELKPVGATQSSYYGNYRPASCIDGDEDTNCRTNRERAPWIAIDFGTSVNIERVDIINGWDKKWGWGRTRNVVVSISDKLMFTDDLMFSGGTVLGRFAGGPGVEYGKGRITILGQKLL